MLTAALVAFLLQCSDFILPQLRYLNLLDSKVGHNLYLPSMYYAIR